MEFYTLDQLMVEGVDIGPIAELEVHNGTGSHGWMKVRAQIGEEKEDQLLYGLASRQQGKLYGGSRLLFAGVLSHVEFFRKDQVRYASLIFRTATCLMDVEKKSRSFQNTSMTYSELLSLVLGDYPNADFVLSVPDRPLGELLVQYKETDWQFLKRVFSQQYTSLGASMNQEGIRIYAGVPNLESQWEYQLEAVTKEEAQVRRFQDMRAGGPDFMD